MILANWCNSYSDILQTMGLIQQLCGEIEESIRAAHKLADGLTDEQFNNAPAGGGWSIAQCIAHLTLTFEQFEPRFVAAIAEARAQGVTGEEPFRNSLLERVAIKGVEPPPSFKVKAPTPFVMLEPCPPGRVLQQYEDAHRRLQAIFRSADGLDLARIRVSHPAISIWKQRLGASFLILTGHCRRHLWQAARVREGLLAPLASTPVSNNS
jgi:hypothetical protein